MSGGTKQQKRKPSTYEQFTEDVWFDVENITVFEWLKRGEEKYGKDASTWKYRCPACGRISSGQDFTALGFNMQKAYMCCIGRVNGKGSNDQHDRGFGCNWAAGGLLRTLGKGVVVSTPDGKTIEVFPFAD